MFTTFNLKVSRLMKSFALVLLIYLSQNAYSQSGSFITTWQVDASDLTIEIPTTGSGYHYDVKWGDGSQTINLTGSAYHSYGAPGTYTVIVTGDFPRINFGSSSAATKIQSIENWGTYPWTSMQNAFSGCENLVINALDSPNLSQCTNLFAMFKNCTSLDQPIGHWDLGAATRTDQMFLGATSFNQDISNWDMSNIDNINGMFSGATAFNQDLSAWDVSNVTKMWYTFRDATSFNQPMDNWDVGSVTTMSRMFQRASSFNQNLNDWDVSQVSNMIEMFDGASSFNGQIDQWDVSNVAYMGLMFRDAISFNQPIGGWQLGSLISCPSMFQGASSFNQPIGSWDMSSVTQIRSMFFNASSFNQTINNWDVGLVTDMSFMFEGAISFNQNLVNWNVSAVTNMRSMFEGATSFNGNIAGWNVSSLTNMRDMFRQAVNFDQDINSWDVSAVTNMQGAFAFSDSFDQTLDNWNVNNVTNMSNMLNNTALSRENYDATLIGWASLPSHQTGVNVGVVGLVYCDGEVARQSLIDDYGWSFSNDALDCPIIPGHPVQDYVVTATNSIHIKQGAEVHSGSVLVNQNNAPPYQSSHQLTVGQNVILPIGETVSSNDILVKSGAIVNSDVHYNTLTNNGLINGNQVTPLALPVISSLPVFNPAELDGTELDITVLQNDSIVLTAGEYGNLKVKKNGIVHLTGGEYHFTSIDAGDQAQLIFSAPGEVRVDEKMNADQKSYIGPEINASFDASDLIFYVDGINGNNGNLGSTPKALKLGRNSLVFANFYVPNGTIWIRDGKDFGKTGSFIGRDVIVGEKVNMYLDSYFASSAGTVARTNQEKSSDEYSKYLKSLNDISEESFLGQFEVYPNPSAGLVNINYHSQIPNEKLLLRIYSLSGTELFKESYNGDIQEKIDFSKSKHSMVIGVIETSSSRLLEKIVIKR